MQVRHLDHISMTVGDDGRAAEWCERVFGFELVEGAATDAVRWGVTRSEQAVPGEPASAGFVDSLMGPLHGLKGYRTVDAVERAARC